MWFDIANIRGRLRTIPCPLAKSNGLDAGARNQEHLADRIGAMLARYTSPSTAQVCQLVFARSGARLH
jgi:hypothetical protein